MDADTVRIQSVSISMRTPPPAPQGTEDAFREERCELRSPGSSIGGSGTLSGCLLTGRGGWFRAGGLGHLCPAHVRGVPSPCPLIPRLDSGSCSAVMGRPQGWPVHTCSGPLSPVSPHPPSACFTAHLVCANPTSTPAPRAHAGPNSRAHTLGHEGLTSWL